MLPSVVDQSKLPSGFESAYDKVMAAHVKQKRKNQEILQQVTEIIQMGTPAYKEEAPNYLLPVIQAILSEKTIRTQYHTQSRNELTERKIDPYYHICKENPFHKKIILANRFEQGEHWLNRACTECGPVMNVLVYPLVFSRN